MQNLSLSKLLGILGALLLVVAWWFLGWWVSFLKFMIFTPLKEGASDFATLSSVGQLQIAFNRFLESGFGGFLFVVAILGKRGALEKKDERYNTLRSLKHHCIIIICLALVLTFASLFLSYRKIDSPSSPASSYSENIFPPIATGGFPIRAFEYPTPPLGSDIPPPESMAPFLYNFLFWTFISAVISFAIPKKLKDDMFAKMLFITAALFFTMIGFLYLMMQYD